MQKQTEALLEQLRQSTDMQPADVGDLQAEEAIEPLVAIVAREGRLTGIGTAAIEMLHRFEGREALDAVLEAYESADDVNTCHNLTEALAGFGVHDMRILEILLDRIEAAHNRRNLPTWIFELARHGNPKALPRLCEWFNTAELNPADPFDRLIAESIAYAVKTLGGELAVGQPEVLGAAEPGPAEPGAAETADEPATAPSGPLRYDASTPPDRNQWLAATEHDRVSAICQFHVDDNPHMQPDDLGRHAMVHAIVENHLAEAFPGIREACTRLQEEGLSRHEAVHALGQRAVALIAPVLESDAQLDPNELIEAYRQASAASYLAGV